MILSLLLFLFNVCVYCFCTIVTIIFKEGKEIFSFCFFFISWTTFILKTWKLYLRYLQEHSGTFILGCFVSQNALYLTALRLLNSLLFCSCHLCHCVCCNAEKKVFCLDESENLMIYKINRLTVPFM